MAPILVVAAAISLMSSGQRTLPDTTPVASPTALIVGVVTDSAGNAIGGGEVSIDGISLAPLDRFGSFVASVTANRPHIFRVRALGYVPGQFSLVAGPGETRTAQIPLALIESSTAALLRRVTVEAHEITADSYDPGLAGFAHRRETLGVVSSTLRS